MNRGLGISAIVMAVLVGVGATLAFAQQKPTPGERVGIEREGMKDKQPAPPSDVLFEFNREFQGPDGPPPPGMPGDFVFIASELNFGGKVVKGAPYSAQAITESVQTLSDGNRIINKSTAAVYRDSEGRTRREQTLRAIGGFANIGEPPQTILISDPVAGTSYILDPRTRTAQKMPPMSFTFNFKVPPPSADKAGLPVPPPLERVERGQGVIGRADMAPRGGFETNFMWRGSNHPATDEALGKQNVEGVEAEGTRSVMTIPAGEIGNERPIEIISERWYSPELQAVVMTRHSDPRFGESTYRLTNIDRSEPPRLLFDVPADYTLKTGPMGHGEGMGFGGGAGIGGADSIGIFRSGGPGGSEVLNGKATSLPIPVYPPVAKAARATGNVFVEVSVDEDGNVVAAKAVSGHPLLQAAAVTAARNAKFAPSKPSGQIMKGVLVYTFSSDTSQSSKDSN